MWIDISNKEQNISNQLSLRALVTEEDWEIYRKLRTQIEIPFGIRDPAEIQKIIDGVRRVISKFKANWYLATDLNHNVVGSIGLVEFSFAQVNVGRLLDVDIAPQFQGSGYGNQLMESIVAIAQDKNLQALCLKADSHRWVEDWYKRLGFQEVGAWYPNKNPRTSLEL